MVLSKTKLEDIFKQVPPDYYQKGVEKNILQRLWHTNKLKTILQLINSNPSKILDVGCASGWFLSKISEAKPQAKCFGIDIYDQAIRYGKNRYKNLHLKLSDAHRLPYPKRSYDLVICAEVLEHVIEPEAVLNEIYRILSPKGIVIIEMDSGSFLFRLVWYWWTHLKKGVWREAHIQSFNIQKLERLIKKCNFVIIDKKLFNFGMGVAFMVKVVERNIK